MFTIPYGKPSAEERIACLNWPDSFPYAPDVRFSIWHDDKSIHLRYTVEEQTTKAEQNTPGGEVYEDSCVEMFIQPVEGDPRYYNFEWNAAGHLAMACRTSRTEKTPAPLSVIESVRSTPSLGSEPFAEKAAGQWTLEVEIPVSALFQHSLKSLHGARMRINLYKCGDALQTPHYITWAPVRTENPDYHRPEFFVPAVFE